MGSKTIRLITVTREDLLDVAHSLAQISRVSYDPNTTEPLLISLQGSVNSGKSIFPDIIRQDIWGKKPMSRFRGNATYDQRLLCEIDNQKTEYNYIDIAPSSGFSKKRLNGQSYETREERFLGNRKYPGITVIQNKKTDDGAAISVWVEKTVGRIGFYERYDVFATSHSDCMNLKRASLSGNSRSFKLAHAFKAAQWVNSEWARYVEIRIDDSLIEKSPLVGRILAALKTQSRKTKQGLERYRNKSYNDEAAASLKLHARKYAQKL